MAAPLPIEVPVVLLGVSVLLFVVAAGTALHRGAFARRARRVAGTVIGAQRHTSRRSHRVMVTWAPIVRYVVDGQEKTHTSSVSSGTAPAVGTEVVMLYDPSHPSRPDDACLDEIRHLWFYPLLFLILGIVFAVTGGGLLAVAAR